MLIIPELEYPLICVGVKKSKQKKIPINLKLDLINVNTAACWFCSNEGNQDNSG